MAQLHQTCGQPGANADTPPTRLRRQDVIKLLGGTGRASAEQPESAGEIRNGTADRAPPYARSSRAGASQPVGPAAKGRRHGDAKDGELADIAGLQTELRQALHLCGRIDRREADLIAGGWSPVGRNKSKRRIELEVNSRCWGQKLPASDQIAIGGQ